MLSFFPIPYPDELLYSIFARYHIRSGNISPKTTMSDMFGTSTVTAVVDLPSHIDALTERLPSGNKIDSLNLVINNTLFPYYTAFLPEDKVKTVIDAMRGNKGGSLHTTTGIMASTIGTPQYLRFCPMCAEEDKKRYGEYYWHRLHQMPGVLLCPTHSIPIVDSTVNLDNLNRHEFIAASEQNCIVRSMEFKCSGVDREGISLTSIDVFWIISNYDIIREFFIENNGLRDVYSSVLKEKGYATATGRVYEEEFISSFIEFYGHDFLKVVQSDVDCDAQSNWLSSIVRKHRKSFHPVRHLLLMRFLCGSAEGFFVNYNRYLPFGKGPWPCLNAASEHYRRFVIKNINVNHCSDTKLPIGTFKCSCGFIYSRRGPDTSKGDLFKIGRIKRFGPIWEEKLRFLVENKQLGIREISRRLNVDPKTVKAYSEKLGLKARRDTSCRIQDEINETDKENSLIVINEDLSRHRSAWLCAINANPDASKTELRSLAKAHYAWLYRHDRKWLDENSPKPNEMTICNSRVDWKERDTEVLKTVRAAVKEITAVKGKPVRISVSKIGKISGLLGLLEKHIDRMPQTKSYVESVVETDSEYRKRRIIWAIKELNDCGIEPKVWNVMRKAAIRSEYLSEIEDYILNSIALIGNVMSKQKSC